MAGLGDFVAQSGVSIPSIDAQVIGHWIYYIAGGVTIAALLVLLFVIVWLRWKFNKTFVLFRKVNNRIERALIDKGMFERVGIAGDYWFRLRRTKKILPRPKLQIAKNEYWYFEREDGEYINFQIEDIDAVQKLAKAYFVDEDMRLQRLGIQKNLLQRYNKESFWDKYGNVIVGVAFALVVTVCIIIIFNKINDLVKALPELANALKGVADAMRDTAIRQASGVIPANSTI